MPWFARPVGRLEQRSATGIGAAAVIAPEWNWSPLKPYFVGGAGYFALHGDPLDDSSFGVNGGAGTWFGIGGVPLFVELRYYSFNSTSHTKYMPLAIGARF